MEKMKAKNRLRNGTLILCEVFTLCTLIMLLVKEDYDNLPLCIATFGIIFFHAFVAKQNTIK